MKAEELRVGNLVEYLNREIELDTGTFYLLCSNVHDLGFEDLKPIPLTEEKLIEFGFEKEDKKPSEKHSNYYSIYINDYKYSFSFAEFRGDWGFYHSYTDALREEDNNKFDAISFGIKHVHQLQNLHYALTNDELI